MIDLSFLKDPALTSTEKLIMFYLTFFPFSDWAKGYSDILDESERNCRRSLIKLTELKYLQSFKNGYGITCYKLADKMSLIPIESLIDGQNVREKDKMSLTGSESPPEGQDVHSTDLKQPTTLTFVNLTEPNLTNGDFNLENSVSRQRQSDNRTATIPVEPRQRRSHFALAAIPRQPVEKSDYRFSIQERLSQSRSNQFSEGTIFVSGDPPWMYLYRMLADLGITEISHPAAPLVKVPAYNVFVDSLPRFYGMFHRKPVKDKLVYDTVLHCLAYLHTKKHPDFADKQAIDDTFRIFQQEKKNAKGRIELWTPVLQAMQSIYDEEYYGWNPSLNQYRDFWGAEVKFARERGFDPRKDLFYSYFTKLKLMTAEVSNQTADIAAVDSWLRDLPSGAIFVIASSNAGESAGELIGYIRAKVSAEQINFIRQFECFDAKTVIEDDMPKTLSRQLKDRILKDQILECLYYAYDSIDLLNLNHCHDAECLIGVFGDEIVTAAEKGSWRKQPFIPYRYFEIIEKHKEWKNKSYRYSYRYFEANFDIGFSFISDRHHYGCDLSYLFTANAHGQKLLQALIKFDTGYAVCPNVVRVPSDMSGIQGSVDFLNLKSQEFVDRLGAHLLRAVGHDEVYSYLRKVLKPANIPEHLYRSVKEDRRLGACFTALDLLLVTVRHFKFIPEQSFNAMFRISNLLLNSKW